MKIKGNEYYTNDSYILKIFTNNKDLEILVEYHFQDPLAGRHAGRQAGRQARTHRQKSAIV